MRLGAAWQFRQGVVRHGPLRPGEAVEVRIARQGAFWLVRPVRAGYGAAGSGTARRGSCGVVNRRGVTWSVMVRLGTAVRAWRVRVRLGWARPGVAWPGPAVVARRVGLRHGWSRFGKARSGEAVMAWHVKVRYV